MEKKKYIWEQLKALILAIIITLGGVLLSAFIIKLANLDSKYIAIIIQVIRIISILVSILVCFKKGQGFWIRGAILGVIYILIAKLVFSLLSGSFSFGLDLLNDCVLGGATGIISGILAGLIKK